MSAEPLRFAFGLHVHQPIGNFDSVIDAALAPVRRKRAGRDPALGLRLSAVTGV